MSVNVSEDTIRTIVERTIRGATSADNQQPWKFSWDGKTLLIREAFQGLKNADPGRFLNTLNLGTIAETIDIVTSMNSIGLKPEFSYSLDPAELGMKVTFSKDDSRSPDVLLDAIDKRWCDRRAYTSDSVSEPVIQALQSDLYDGIKLYFSTDCDKFNFIDNMNWAKIFMTHRQCKNDMYHWLRFSKRHAESTRDGMYWVTFRDSWMGARILQIMMSPSLFANVFARPVTQAAVRAVRIFQSRVPLAKRKSLFSGGPEALGCITVRKTNSEALVEAGRSVIRIWMRLNREGYSYQPKLTSPLIFSYRRPEAERGSDLAKSLLSGAEIDECLGICHETFKCGEDEIPVWIFRTGLPIGPRNYTTLRKDVNEVLSFSETASV